MRRSDSIFEFIDGSLDSAQEQELFDEMAQQPELRAELRQHIAIGEAVRADREAFVPPADVERALMAGLGLAPIVGGTVGTGIGALARTGALRRVLPIAASFLVGALLAGGGVYMAVGDDAGDRATTSTAARDTVYVETARSSDSASMSSPAAVPSSTLASTQGRESGAAFTSPARQTAHQRNSQARPLAIAPSSDDDAAVLSTTAAPDQSPSDERRAIASVDLRTSTTSLPVVPSAGSEDLAVRLAIAPSDPLSPMLDERWTDNMFVSFRRQLSLLPLRESRAHKVAAQVLDESNIGMFVRTGELTAFGLEVGQGRFNQVLIVPDGYILNGEAIEGTRIEQAPMVRWVGLSHRWMLDDGTGFLQPWFNATAGYGFNNGPILGGRVGGTKNIIGPVSLTASIEGSALFYKFNGQPLVSPKLGVMAGLQFGW